MALLASRVRLILPLLAVGCGGGDLMLPSEGAPAILAVVSGDRQRATAGEPVAEPLVVRVEDAVGRPVQGVSVRFAFTDAVPGAAVSPASVSTDSTGLAATSATLGTQSGEQQVRAALTDTSELRATFRLTALAQPTNQDDDNDNGGGGDGNGGDDDGRGNGNKESGGGTDD